MQSSHTQIKAQLKDRFSLRIPNSIHPLHRFFRNKNRSIHCNHYFLRGRRSAFGQKPREFITNVLFAKLETAMRQKIKPDPLECKETGVKTTAIIPGTQRFSINWWKLFGARVERTPLPSYLDWLRTVVWIISRKYRKIAC